MEDQQIIDLYWAREERALTATAEKYGPYCQTIARNILNDPQDAEECVNDTWLQAWNSIPPQRPRTLAGYLGRLTRNLALNRYIHNTAAKRGGGQTPLVLSELGDTVSDRDDVEAALDRKALAEAINGFLSTLSPEKRRLFLRRYWYFDGVGDLARDLGLTENNVSVRLNRLRRKLRRYLTERGFDL